MLTSDAPPPPPPRHPLPEERSGVTHHVRIRFPQYAQDTQSVDLQNMEIFITVGLYDSGDVGEVFARVDKSGDSVRALVDAWCTAISRGLQSGIPLEWFVDKVIGTRAVFAMEGRTSNPYVPTAVSPVDYIAKWLAWRFLPDNTMEG